MRVSTSEFYRQATQALAQQQSALSRQQLQIASGNRILQPSDDPIGSAQILNLDSAKAQNSQGTRNAGQAESRLALAETTLASVNDNLQRVRELTVRAANDSQTDATRKDMAQEIEQRLDELVDLANTTDANGEYIFAGYQTQTRPFVVTGGNVSYQGDDGQRFVGIGGDRQLAVNEPGSRLFMNVPEGNGVYEVAAAAGNSGSGVIESGSVVDRNAFAPDDYTLTFTAADQYEIHDSGGALVGSGSYTAEESINLIPGIEFSLSGEPDSGDQFSISAAGKTDVFSGYRELIDTLNRPTDTAASEAQFRTGINRALNGLDQTISHTLEARSDIGGRLRVVETQISTNEDRALQLDAARSEIADLDYAEAISQFQQRLSTFQAAQQSFTRIQNLSLFNYLR